MGIPPDARLKRVDVENISHDSQDAVAGKRIKTWKGQLWDTWELPPEERWLLFKLDAFILTFASIGYFLKNLDQDNAKNAFLSSMKVWRSNLLSGFFTYNVAV